MLVRWDEKYRVGNDQIDQEHQYLFQLINEFYDAFAEKRERTLVLALLSRLVDYAERHFTNEEALMRASVYPALDEHHHHHEKLFEQIFDLNEKLANRAFNPSHETALFLKSWLADHIVQEDTLLGAHLQNKKNDGAKTPQTA